MTLRCLVLDDEPAIRRLISKRLRGIGYQVTEAASVAEATAILATRTFDAALIDWELGSPEPGETGFAVANLLRRHHPLCARIIVSGHSVFEMRASWQDPLQAILAFVEKPINFDGESGRREDSLLEILRRVERSKSDTPPHGTPIA